MLAAGYVSFGHSVDFGFSVGDGVVIATLDPVDGRFRIVAEAVRLPSGGVGDRLQCLELAALGARGAGLCGRLPAPGRDGPRGRDFNMRWLAAAVGELHRILRRGGMFFYAADRRPGYASGRLRLVYEASPIAFLCEQAGGAATDGARPILDACPRRCTSTRRWSSARRTRSRRSALCARDGRDQRKEDRPMARITLRQLLDHAAEHGYGVPAFNMNNMEQGLAIMAAAEATRSPVILQASRGARAYAGDLVLARMIDGFVAQHPDIPVCMHLDHGNDAGDLRHRDPARLHLGDDGRLAEGGRQDAGRLRLQRRHHPRG